MTPRQRTHAAVAEAKARTTQKAKDAGQLAWWVCQPERFYDRAHERAKELALTSTTVSYVKPWGQI